MSLGGRKKRGRPGARGLPPKNVSVCFQFMVCIISYVRLIGYLLDRANTISAFPGASTRAIFTFLCMHQSLYEVENMAKKCTGL